MIDQWIETHNLNENKRVLVLLDNCPIHLNIQTISFMNTTRLWYMFLPIYTPSFAPIELIFANLKRKIACINTNEITN